MRALSLCQLLLLVLCAVGLVSCVPVTLTPLVKNETAGLVLFSCDGATCCVAPGEEVRFPHADGVGENEQEDSGCLIVNARGDQLFVSMDDFYRRKAEMRKRYTFSSLLAPQFYQVLRVQEDKDGKLVCPDNRRKLPSKKG